MQIIHKIDNFLYTIFPYVIQGDQQSLLNAIQDFYTLGPYKPKVTIDNDFVSIEIDTPTILAQDLDYQKVIAFCEKGKYADAKPILKKLIEKNPAISEYHRIMGQILSDEGDQEEAINCLIDALQFFEGKLLEEIKKIAFEIAMQGTQGYRPDKDNYRINSIKDKTFSGYHILAYYYVSWSLAIPEMVSQLNLPYEAEYKMALTMHKPNK